MNKPFLTQTKKNVSFDWQELASLPQPIAGQFVGVCGETLLVAGGTSWDAAPWAGGTKAWTDKVQVFAENKARWRVVGHLPYPLAYGAAISTPQGVICIGGQTSAEISAKVFCIRLENNELFISELPKLPQPATMLAAARVGDTIYVAGGQSRPVASEAMCNFWSLKLSDSEAMQENWQELEAWAGDPRILPVAIGTNEDFYLISGANLYEDENGTIQRRNLIDAHCYNPKTGWRRIADVPQPCVAAPALHPAGSGIFVFGGDNGQNAMRIWELRDNHPGFSRDILNYCADVDEWEVSGKIPFSLVTTGAVIWKNKIVVAGGEDRPGSRSAQVITGRLADDNI